MFSYKILDSMQEYVSDQYKKLCHMSHMMSMKTNVDRSDMIVIYYLW